MHIADSSSGKAISLTLFNGFLDRFHEIAPKVTINDKVYKGFACAFFVSPNQRFPQGILLVLHADISRHGIAENVTVSGMFLMHFRGHAS